MFNGTKIGKCFFLLLIVMIVSCVKKIDFEIPAEFSDTIVVQGRVVKGNPSFIEVNVSRLFDFTPESRQPINVKEVIISDDRGNVIELETDEAGSYLYFIDETSDLQAEIGVGYKINVLMFDGRRFESDVDVMIPNQDINELHLTMSTERVINNAGLNEDEPRIQLSIDSELDPENEGGLYWDVNSIYRVTDANFITESIFTLADTLLARVCYITMTTSSTDTYVFDAKESASNEIRNFDLIKIPITPTLVEGYYFEVKQYSLSEDAFSYWKALDLLVENEGGIFDKPVGELPSNLKNINDPDESVFGYFFAAEEKIQRKRVPEEFFEGLQRSCFRVGAFCFNGPGGACTCGVCCDCLAEENSTEERPAFWED